MEGLVKYDILRSKINEALPQTQDFLNAIFENTFQYDTRWSVDQIVIQLEIY